MQQGIQTSIERWRKLTPENKTAWMAERADVPKLFADAVIVDFADEDIATVQALNAVADSPNCNVLLYGDTGTGKSHAAAALLRVRVPHHRQPAPDGGLDLTERTVASVHWLCVPEWLYTFRAGFTAKAPPPAYSVDAAKRESILVLDDIGAENCTDWTAETIYVVVNARVQQKRTTIVTTNLGPKALAEWNPRLASRLLGFERIALLGRDRRITQEDES